MSDYKHTDGHPGHYIRDHVIPKGISVTQAAKALGVGRPALSNLLNGNAGLSPDMAARLEKAFGSVKASDLLQIQSQFDAGKYSALASASLVMPFVLPFLKVKANDIEEWASQLDSRATLAVLLRLLVNSTCAGLTKVDFPAYDDSQRYGWDGEVETGAGYPWVPDGKSGWEFSTRPDILTKANEDYSQRVTGLTAEEREQLTFVFVTPRRWAGKKNWRKDKLAEGKWKHVSVLDASDLEQWMEQSIPAQVWFENRLGRDFRGTKSLDRCWQQWNADCEPAFTTAIFEEASITWRARLCDHLKKEPGRILTIAAESKLEGLAFVHAMLPKEEPESLALRDRMVVFEETGPLTQLATGGSRFIPIVTTPESERELSETGAKLGGISIVNRTMAHAETDIVLDILSDRALFKALESMGVNHGRIERLSTESGRSLTVLRRRLAKGKAIRAPQWSADQTLTRTLFPCMLAGAWDQFYEDDKAVLCHLAGCNDYDEIETNLRCLQALESPPVWSVGSFRGVTSKVDCLYAIHGAVRDKDMERFREVVTLVLCEADQSRGKPEGDCRNAALYRKSRNVSPALRAGLADSLVLLATHGNTLFERYSIKLDTDTLVRRLLESLDASALASQSRNLPRYAEASPDEFLRFVEADLSANDPETRVLVRPGPLLLIGTPPAGLLSALETLAWSPDYLCRVIYILAQLAELDSTDRSGNSAMQSLCHIFRSWMPQTAAPVEMRIKLFDGLVTKHADVAWTIAMAQLTRGPTIGLFSTRPKWRDFASGHGEPVAREEALKFDTHCLDAALSWNSPCKAKLADLIERLDRLAEQDCARLWPLVREWSSQASDEERASLREKIMVETHWSVLRRNKSGRSQREIQALTRAAKRAYDTLEPQDTVWKHVWLFRNAWIEPLWEDIDGKGLARQEREALVAMERQAAVDAVYESGGFDEVVRLALDVSVPRMVGNALSETLSEEKSQLQFVMRVVADRDFPSSLKLQSLLEGFFSSIGDEKAIEHIKACRPDVGDELVARSLCLCRFGRETWAELDRHGSNVSAAYWKHVPVYIPHKCEHEIRFAVEKLLEAKRAPDALLLIHMDLELIHSEQLYRLLLQVHDEIGTDHYHSTIDVNSIRNIFNILNQRKAIDRQRMARLEFLYIGFFQYNAGYIPNLEAELNGNPALFCDAVRLTYKEGHQGGTSFFPEKQKHLSRNAHIFLDTLSAVPGRDKHGKIQAVALKNWINNVRKISEETGHPGDMDYWIGELLAHAPKGQDDAWPCEPVRDVVNKLYSEGIAKGIRNGRCNLRGVHIRGENGNAERILADTYETWAKTCDYDYPQMAHILRELKKVYLGQAGSEDTNGMIGKRLRY